MLALLVPGAPRIHPRPLRALLLGVLISITYVVAARVGFALAFLAEQVTTVWAPTGIGIAVLLLGGIRFWPAIWVGAFLANAGTDAPVWTAPVIATGNTLEAVAATALLRRYLPAFDTRFCRVADVAGFVVIAAVLCPTISATLGVTTLAVAGVQPWDRFASLWFDWWFGDALGAALVAPAVLTAARESWSRPRALQAFSFTAAAMGVTVVVFGQLLGPGTHPLEFVVFPVVIVAAVVGGPGIAAVTVLGTSATAIWLTVQGLGPFAGPDIHLSLVVLQVFMGVLGVTAMLLAAAIAERTRAEREAREAARALGDREEMLRLAQRAGGVATFEWDIRNQVAQCSTEFFRLFGLPARDGAMTGAEWSRYVHAEDRERLAAHLARALDGTEAAAADYRIVAADGTVRWLTYAGELQRTPLGDRMLGTVVDISDRKRLEGELRRHSADVEAAKAEADERRLELERINKELRRRVLEQQTLLDVLPIGIGIALDRECRHIRTNRAFAEILGVPPHANASKTAPPGERPTNFRVLAPDGSEVADDQLPMQIAAREGREVRDVELDVIHEDGRVVRLLEYAAPLSDEHGVPHGAVGVFVDVTALHRTRAELRQEVEVRTALSQAGASLARELRSETLVQAVTDIATQLTEAEFGAFFSNVTNEDGDAYALSALTGARPEAFSGFPHPRATALFGPTFSGEAVLRLDDVTKDSRFGRNPPYHGMPAGHLPVRSYLAVPVVGRGGVVLGSLLFGHSQAGMFAERHETLASGVAGWAAIALDNARLYRDAEDANRLKDEFLATLSHELRTPLNAVLGWARMLRQGAIQPSMQRRALESIERNAAVQAQLVDDLLDISRSVAGKLQINADAVDLADVVANAVDTVQAGAVAKGLRLTAHLPPDRRIKVTGDADRLQQVVWNLLSNAIKFTPAGGRVDVELSHSETKAELLVRDTGQGISPSFRPQLFQRFRQMDSSKTRLHGGLGLGLSIVRHIVEAHGGAVSAESEGVGRGATFSVILPLQAVEEAGAADVRAPQAATAGALRGLHAAVVDDHADARELVQFILEGSGATVVAVASAGEALHLLARQRFDVLLADIGMPEQDGLALIRVLRSQPEGALNRQVPAIAVTAFTAPADRDAAIEAGFTCQLPKPVDPDVLVAAVASVVERQPVR